MKKKYSLDFSIERDTERVAAVTEILDTMATDPSATELEQMANYILYGKDENG
jgi:spore coat protein CotH